MRKVALTLAVAVSVVVLGTGLTSASHAPDDVKFVPVAFGTYRGDAGPVKLKIQEGEERNVMTLQGRVPVGGSQDYHFHPQALWLVTVQAGTVDLYRANDNCAASRYTADADGNDVFIEHGDNIHKLVNAGDTEAMIHATGILVPGNEITVRSDPPCAD